MTRIREIVAADYEPLAVLHVKTWRSAYAGIVPASTLAALDPVQLAERRRSGPAPAGARTLVADDAGVITGFVSFGPDRTDPDAGLDSGSGFGFGFGEVYAIYVDPDRQGHGIGKLLYQAAAEGLAEYGGMRLWVLTENHAARGFYERMGMTPDGATEFYKPRDSDARLPEMRYAVRL